MTYDDARARLADWLDRHATASANRPHDGYDELDALLPRDPDPRWDKIFIALHFWDGWIDASNHDWRYYEPILKSDWPILARELASDLRADREVSNAAILERFDFRPNKVRS